MRKNNVWTYGGVNVISLFDNTPPEVEEMLIESYRRMSPQQKLQWVIALNQLATARLRKQYGDLSEHEWDYAGRPCASTAT